ncbi:MAG: hypothetical protein JWP18_520 [Solirubrobacterales bacterium]|nr:hypothetical protein [Solirubrobacterales bacterium]
MRKRITTAILAAGALGVAGTALAAGQSTGAGSGSRLDDGADLLSQATITEQQAIRAAQGAADGGLGEVDLEHVDGRLVFNVDVGRYDVKVDAADGHVVRVDQDD